MSWSGVKSFVVVLCASSHTQGSITLEQPCRYGNADVEATTRNGWHQMILRRIKMVFGYGM